MVLYRDAAHRSARKSGEKDISVRSASHWSQTPILYQCHKNSIIDEGTFDHWDIILLFFHDKFPLETPFTLDNSK